MRVTDRVGELQNEALDVGQALRHDLRLFELHGGGWDTTSTRTVALGLSEAVVWVWVWAWVWGREGLQWRTVSSSVPSKSRSHL